MTTPTFTKIDTQAALEASALEAGIQRYRTDQDRREKRDGLAARDNVSQLIRGAIPILSAAIADWKTTAASKKGRKPESYLPLLELDNDTLAYIALSQTFTRLPQGGQVVAITVQIGRSVKFHIEALLLETVDPEARKRISRMAVGGSGGSRITELHEHLSATADVSLGWDMRKEALIGDSLLNVLLVSLSDIFQRGEGIFKNGKLPIVALTDEAADALNAMTEAVEWMRPSLQPMVTVPNPWNSMYTGCYNEPKLARRVPLVRTYVSEGKRLVKAAIEDGSMDMVLAATNALQETRFAIDERILDVMLWVKEQGLQPSSSFPASKLPPVPDKVDTAAWELMTKEHRAALSRQRKAVKLLRAAAGVDVGMFTDDTDMATFLLEEEVFYIPHSLDFRGRSYAVPHFNHQRSDHMKALFRFADGVPLGPDGGDWLMIHLANCGDFDKMTKQPFENRIDWCHDNELDILMCARDPQGSYDFWSKADSPFCFLQACFEYDAWMQTGFSEDYVSYVSGAADGSCSGLQHYSAITRSADEAYHVNLLPRDTVGDIYQVVADEALPAMIATHADLSNDDHEKAGVILSLGFGRGDVKRNVMTYFYGSGRFGMRDQHMQDTMRPLADQVAMGHIPAHPYEFEVEKVDADTGEVTPRMDGGFGCANVLAGHVYNAVVAVAPKADEAASWIQSVAAVLAHEGLSMVWTTPCGLPVVHRYSEYTSKAVNMWLYDRSVLVPTGLDKVDPEGNVLTRVQLLIREAPTKRVAKKRMRSASSPNVIHSMDGAHLQRSVVWAVGEGIRHFSMIHDSFGTHFGNMGKFSRIIREAFVATYADYCPLASIDAHARTVLSDAGIEKLPPIPAKGTLDLNAVLSSLYAFA